MTRLWPSLLHLSFLTNIHRRTLSPKYLLIARIPSSCPQWAFFPSANTIFHQIKTLLPGGNRFPVCNLLSHILPLLCYNHSTLVFYLHLILQKVCLFIQLFMFSQPKYKVQLLHHGCFLQLLTGHQSDQLFSHLHSTHSFTICSRSSGSNIRKHDHPTLHR